MELPRSVGIIPDGNRRWARKVGVGVERAYLIGVRNAERVADYLLGRGVDRVFFYLLSEDNCRKRRKEELGAVEKAVRLNLTRGERLAASHGAFIVTIGDFNLLPEDLREVAERYSFFRRVKEGVLDKPSRLLVVGVCYSLSWEFRVSPCKPLTPMLGEIDLVIRSGGEKRLSGFFPLLTTYSELYFLDKLWPEVTIDDVEDALRWYAGRERRRGA
ncbi:MAG: undecaprenyl diphosphate synthase family protein [Desulfurococcales archaeon]|nr:undecaprenyl diphosphate synthase family protein [Desulfurococcales archaeon]